MTASGVVFPPAGQSARATLTFDHPLLDGLEWPYFAINGAHAGPTVALIAGIHGAEYPPIDAVIRFCRTLDPLALHGRVIGVPLINLLSFWERTPFVCPRDGKNPNRVFPGRVDGTFTEVLAHYFFQQVISQGDYLIDLHCGDLVEELEPFCLLQESGNAALDATALDLAMAFGLPYVIQQPATGGPIGGTTNGAAAAVGIPAVIAEVGGVGQLDNASVQMHLRGLQRVFQRLQMLEGTPDEIAAPVIVRQFVWARAERGGFFRKTVSAGDHLKAGQPLGEMVDLWGERVGTVTSPATGVALFVTTSPAIADNGLLIGIGVPA